MKRTVGILGGGGPLASALFHLKLVQTLNNQGCVEDRDYPTIIHFSANVGNLSVLGNSQGDLLEKQWLAINQQIFRSPSIQVVVPCNSLCHALAEHQITGFTNIIEVTVQEAVNRIARDKKLMKKSAVFVKIWASPYLIENKAYTKELHKVWQQIADPKPNLAIEYEPITNMALMIQQLLQPKMAESAKKKLKKRINTDEDLHILGCTELSWILSEKDNIVDSGQTLINYLLNQECLEL